MVDSRLYYAIPIIGMPYEFWKTRSVKHSAPGAIGSYIAMAIGKRAVHAWLGSAGQMMPSAHYARIAKDAFTGPTSPFKRGPSAFMTLGVGVHLLNLAEEAISRIERPQQQLM